jgi:hypothetical protein
MQLFPATIQLSRSSMALFPARISAADAICRRMALISNAGRPSRRSPRPPLQLAT